METILGGHGDPSHTQEAYNYTSVNKDQEIYKCHVINTLSPNDSLMTLIQRRVAATIKNLVDCAF